MIWTIVLWMGMQGQAVSIQDIQVSEAEPQHCIVGAQEVSCTTGMPGITETMKRPAEWQCNAAPIEPVFEIRTKREERPISNGRCPEGFAFSWQPCVDEICYPTAKKYAHRCNRVTRELWIDGHRLGIILGLQ